MTAKSRQLNVEEGRLIEVKRKKRSSYDGNDKQRIWNECLWKAYHKNLKVGAAAHMYRKKTGVWPRKLENIPHGDEWQLTAKYYLDRRKIDGSREVA